MIPSQSVSFRTHTLCGSEALLSSYMVSKLGLECLLWDTLVMQEEELSNSVGIGHSAICISYLNLVVKLGVAFGAQEAERSTVKNASKNPPS